LLVIATLLLSLIPVLVPAPAQQPTAAAATTQSTAPTATTGTVRDASGAVVSGAIVIARTPSGSEQRSVTGPNGGFSIALPAPFELTVMAGGFAVKKQDVVTSASPVAVTLSPAGLQEQVTVTATRGEQRLGDVPASVTVLSREDIRQSAAVNADGLLRQLPQFSLFRRSSSMSVHPTSQGVSLRGIGPSGVSRSLVLVDGIPYNDPFGGWVYWTGLPTESADRIEVVDNSSSSLYGNYAMGGVINILTSKPTPKTVELKMQYGSRNTPKVDYRVSHVMGKLGVSLSGSAFDTDGFINVVPSERRVTDSTPPGVDNNINARFRNVHFKADYAATDRVQLFGRVGYFRENRDNGKSATYTPTGTYIGGQTKEANDTTWKTSSFGTRMQLPDQSSLQANIFTDNEVFSSNFLAVPFATPLRSIGRISLNQSVPTKGVGGMVQWTKAISSKEALTAGFDWRWVEGESQEQAFNSQINVQTPTIGRLSGGTQRLMGFFIQNIITPSPKWQMTLSARVDRWRNYNAHNLETTTATGAPTANYRTSCSAATPSTLCLGDRQDTVVSPRAAALYRLTNAVSVWGDYGLGFRAPTLNELYRQFSVGAVVTRANSALGPERLKGGEIGVNVNPMPGLNARATWFDNRVKDPVANVTIGTNTQQRQNLGRTRISGIQTDVDYRMGNFWRFNGAYLYERARVVEAKITGLPAGTSLGENCPGPNAAGTGAGTGTGKPCFLAQVPKNRASFRVVYANEKYATVAFGIQMVGRQFDEDQNARVIPAAALAGAGYDAVGSPVTSDDAGMPGYSLVDLMVSRTVTRNFEAFLAGENLLNKDYFVGTVPTLLGPPRLVMVGFRLRWQGN
jgi:outer membrane receptor protein involved in Fe transport